MIPSRKLFRLFQPQYLTAGALGTRDTSRLSINVPLCLANVGRQGHELSDNSLEENGDRIALDPAKRKLVRGVVMDQDTSQSPPASAGQSAGERLDSWKEIAAYLKRDIRTVRRWEKSQSLPVHRHSYLKRGLVYAYKHELDAWWHDDARNGNNASSLPTDPVSEAATNNGNEPDAANIIPAKRHLRWRWLRPSHGQTKWAILVLAVLIGAGGIFYFYYGRSVHAALTDKDGIVLADFTNKTGDSIFDGTLNEALSADLGQSPFFNILSDRKVREALKQMKRRADEQVTPELAFEICVRTGSSVVLTGSIVNLGAHYAIGLKAMNCQSGDVLGAAEVEAENREEILSSLGRATSRLRQRLGESRASIERFDKLLAATTSSLEALQAFTQAHILEAKNPNGEAIPLLKHAIELDPKFARAYGYLSVLQANQGEMNESLKNLSKAYELRELISEQERDSISIQYHHRATGEIDKTMDELRMVVARRPQLAAPHFTLGLIHTYLGEYETAITETREYQRRAPNVSYGYANLGLYYTWLGRLDEAEAVLDEAAAHKIEGAFLIKNRYDIAFLKDDRQGMRQQVAVAAGNPATEAEMLVEQAGMETYYGRLANARKLTLQAAQVDKRKGSEEHAAFLDATGALREAEFGNFALARRSVTTTIALSSDRGGRIFTALALARSGAQKEAIQIIEEQRKEHPLNTVLQSYWVPCIYSAVDLANGRFSTAMTLLEPTRPYELGNVSNFGPMLYSLYLRGQIHLSARQATEAATEFQKVIDHKSMVALSQGPYLLPLSYLGLGRARVLEARLASDRKTADIAREQARTAYRNLFSIWKEADADNPVLLKARIEYAKLETRR
jgi:eukaryotic-like serine/threonine-protein kinase